MATLQKHQAARQLLAIAVLVAAVLVQGKSRRQILLVSLLLP